MIYKRHKIQLRDSDVVADCINALDYPALIPDDKWVIWTAHGKWPDADRHCRYLSKTQLDAARGFALLTGAYRDAMRFDTEAEARTWLEEQNAMRQLPWSGLNVTTVAQLKLACGFYVEESTNAE